MAGLLILIINIIGGLAIGMFQHDLSLATRADLRAPNHRRRTRRTDSLPSLSLAPHVVTRHDLAKHERVAAAQLANPNCALRRGGDPHSFGHGSGHAAPRFPHAGRWRRRPRPCPAAKAQSVAFEAIEAARAPSKAQHERIRVR